MSLAERWSSDSSLLSLQYHTNPVTLLEQEAGKRGCSPDSALEQFRLRRLVEGNVRIENDHNIGNPLRLRLVNDQSTVLRGSLPVDPLRIVSRNVSPHTVELRSRSKGPSRQYPGPRTEMTRTKLRTPDSFRPRYYRQHLRIRPSLYKVQPERIPRPNDYRPDRVVTSNRAGEAQLHIQFLKRLHLHQYPRNPLLNLDRIRNQFVNLHVSQLVTRL